MSRIWQVIPGDVHGFDGGPGARASIGVIGLSVDRASVVDCGDFLAPFPGADMFVTRVPMSPVCTPVTLAEMGDHLSAAAALLVPESPLHAVAFACTSGLVAIGAERVHRAIAAGRPGVPVVTPLEAAAKGLARLGARRLSILAPYHEDACNLIAGHFEAAGFTLDRCTTFDLDGDLQMNRLSGDALKAGAARALHPDSDALFISCTALRTSGIIADLERALGVPVVTSNQAIVWDCLRHAGERELSRGEGLLFGLAE